MRFVAFFLKSDTGVFRSFSIQNLLLLLLRGNLFSNSLFLLRSFIFWFIRYLLKSRKRNFMDGLSLFHSCIILTWEFFFCSSFKRYFELNENGILKRHDLNDGLFDLSALLFERKYLANKINLLLLVYS